MNTLQTLFLDELADMYDAEKRILKALPKMEKAATDPQLQGAFRKHLAETEGHVEKLERIFSCFDTKAKGKTCEATVGLLKEGDEMAADNADSSALNAALIAAAQKVEHYEIASYGTLLAWAELLGNDEAASLLDEILNEEKGANETLNEIATTSANEEALKHDSVPARRDDASPSHRGSKGRSTGK